MSVLRRLYNVAYGKVKTSLSADEAPLADEVERLRPAPLPARGPADADEAEPAPGSASDERGPTAARPRRL